jgi:hypothetical protein
MKTTLKRVPQPSTATAMKAERERDKAQAVRDYEAEQLARQANMARLGVPSPQFIPVDAIFRAPDIASKSSPSLYVSVAQALYPMGANAREGVPQWV